MLPSAAPVPALRQTTDAFPGLDCRPRPVAGACAALKNLVGGEYPVLSSRPGRGTVATLRDPGGLLAKDALCYVDGGSLYVNGYAVDLGLTSGSSSCSPWAPTPSCSRTKNTSTPPTSATSDPSKPR